MFNIVALFFTAEFSSEIDPFQLLLGTGIGIVVIVVLIKKIINRKKDLN